MQDAFGGILNITIVAVFFILVSSILAMTVNYTKAFRMKNYVIATIEQYEGSGCGCGTKTTSGSQTSCRAKIAEHAKSLGYSPKNINCDGGSIDGLFCCSVTDGVYSVTTQVDIDFPIIDRVMGMKALQVHGDTRPINK